MSEQSRLGFFTVTGHPMIAELFGVVGADFVVVDLEAAPLDKAGSIGCVQALAASGAQSFVRVPWLERHWIEHALDTGAHGVVVPKVDTAEDAARAVEAAFFPPVGRRGLNPVRASNYFVDFADYVHTANDRTEVFVQIESREAVVNVREIAAVPGLGGLFIGSGDLVADFGEPGNMTVVGMAEAKASVLAACAGNGLVPGIFAYSLGMAEECLADGFRFVAVGNEAKMLAGEAQRCLTSLRPPAEATHPTDTPDARGS